MNPSHSNIEERQKTNNLNPWCFDDLADLVDAVGLRSIDSIAEWLGKSPEEVDIAAFLLGLDTELVCPDLFWCDHCASWRTQLDSSGKCEICTLRDKITKCDIAINEALSLLNPEDRAIYTESEFQRDRRKKEAPPILTVSPTATRRERKAIEAFQAVATESWESRCLIRDCNAAKTRLKRIRKKSGTNPRMGKVKPSDSDQL